MSNLWDYFHWIVLTEEEQGSFRVTYRTVAGQTMTGTGRCVGEALVKLSESYYRTALKAWIFHSVSAREFRRLATEAVKKWNDAHPGDNLLMLNPTEKRT